MKTYKKSAKCELVYVSVPFNLMNDDERNDFEYINKNPNRARKIKECVRAIRLGRHTQYTLDIPDVLLDTEPSYSEEESMTEESDAVTALI